MVEAQTYEKTWGATNSAFAIKGDQQLKINETPDYETKSSYSIWVQTTVQKGASYQEQSKKSAVAIVIEVSA